MICENGLLFQWLRTKELQNGGTNKMVVWHSCRKPAFGQELTVGECVFLRLLIEQQL